MSLYSGRSVPLLYPAIYTLTPVNLHSITYF